MGQTVNLLVFTFGGSNPSSPTRSPITFSGFYFEKQSFSKKIAEVAQSVEHQPSKLRVAGSNPVFRSIRQCSSAVEHFLGKEEVTGSSPVIGSDF